MVSRCWKKKLIPPTDKQEEIRELQAGAVAHANLNISQGSRYFAHAVYGFPLSTGQMREQYKYI